MIVQILLFFYGLIAMFVLMSIEQRSASSTHSSSYTMSSREAGSLSTLYTGRRPVSVVEDAPDALVPAAPSPRAPAVPAPSARRCKQQAQLHRRRAPVSSAIPPQAQPAPWRGMSAQRRRTTPRVL